ncbi:MAG: hypothetical protein HY741_20415 [Chloroflexi bacterium]|nr:hypothetical protein [Chloroflexota bacterium]
MTEKRYEQLIHLLAVVVATVLWFISVQFSADGFKFVLPRYAWIGYVLAIAVTVIELVFNEEGMNHTLTLVTVGLLSYGYGIVTNIIGIWAAQGSPDLAANPLALLFPALLGLFLEISPEPLLFWGLIGTGARDFLAQLLNSNTKKAY